MTVLGPGRNGPKKAEKNIESVIRVVKDKLHTFPIGLAVKLNQQQKIKPSEPFN